MKRLLTLLLAVFLVALSSLSADDIQPASVHLEFKNTSTSRVLPNYAKLSDRELVIDSRAKKMEALITLKIDGVQSKEEVLKQIREAFLKQARIVITQLDEKRDSVTFNDALPLPK